MGERTWNLAALGFVFILMAFSGALAVSRIYQVDEIQNIFTARLIGDGADARYILSAPLFVIGPFAWLTSRPEAGADILVLARLLFLPLFWLNSALVVVAAGLQLRSRAGLVALIASSTLAPLWDYGFEVRHDNLLLTLSLAGFCLARLPSVRTRLALVGVGVVCALMQFTALKAFVYWLPIALVALIVDRAASESTGRIQRSVLIGVGMAAGGALAILAHMMSGTWEIFLGDTRALFAVASGTDRLSPIPTLLRIANQAPLYLASILVMAAWLTGTDGRRLLHARPDGVLPELIWSMAGLAALILNPTPFPYNLVLVMPLGAVVLARVLASRRDGPPLPQGIVAVLCLVHIGTWAMSTRRHLDMTNDRQIQLVELAEALTNPEEHRVLDGAGLVVSRLPPGPQWLIHMLTFRRFADGTYTPIRAQLSSSSTPVVILNYRTGNLPRPDIDFITTHYLPLAGDFWVTGIERGPGETTWDCLVGGRYHVDIEGDDTLLDEVPLKAGVNTIARGKHSIRVREGAAVRLYWLGPNLEGPLMVRPGEPRAVFSNWY